MFGRQGLGHTGNKGAVTPAFRKRVREIVSDYASASKNVALAFSNDFSKEQRAEIHKCVAGWLISLCCQWRR